MAPASNGKIKQSKSHKASKNEDVHRSNRGTGQHVSQNRLHQLSTGVPLQLQQSLVDIFKITFEEHFNDSLGQVIQDVKKHLFNRDFAQAFGNQTSLDAYVIRWSPSRALAYLEIFNRLDEVHGHLQSHQRKTYRALSDKPEGTSGTITDDVPASQDKLSLSRKEESTQRVKVVSLGGGAGAELVALAGLLCGLGRSTNGDCPASADSHQRPLSLDVALVDVADWSSVIARLHAGLTNNPAEPEYASYEAARTTTMVDHDLFRVSFAQQDLLKMEVSQMGSLFRDCALVTLMFTLNELYSTSMSGTTNFLLSMTELIQPGSLLLVVDSPGSYSTINLGRDERVQDTETQKRYPMLWLLDHTLLNAAVGSNGKKQWEKLEENNSKWFRLPDLNYPIDLENMRYQMHLYRRT
ncbi:25S rRNA (uridine(2843)-N(3))-methyltransferase [Physcia stellaris]|nr:25S rRNA (uridine(2843)-N(3))-methyltransferase [Physcia stellaris]